MSTHRLGESALDGTIFAIVDSNRRIQRIYNARGDTFHGYTFDNGDELIEFTIGDYLESIKHRKG